MASHFDAVVVGEAEGQWQRLLDDFARGRLRRTYRLATPCDPTVFEATLDILDRHAIDALQLNILTPLPGTPLFHRLDAEGRIRDRDFRHYDFRHVVIEPKGMTAEELQAGADWLYREFYRPHRILRRAASAVRTLGPFCAWLGFRLNLTYLRDNRREGIVGWNPARSRATPAATARPGVGLAGRSCYGERSA